MRRSILTVAAAAFTFAVVAAPREARAGVYVGGQFDAASPINAPAGYGSGYGFVGQLAYRFKLGPVFLQPEGQGSYMVFPVDDGNSPSTHATRAMGGARFGLGSLVQPTLFGHAGMGWLGKGVDGPAFDGGFALGFKLIPYLRFGAQVAYNVIRASNDAGVATTFKWLSYGAHVGIEF